ncbi:class I SAM-dependent methyltransferase [Sulfobacillus thermosulfidooxidans]|uniref:class I SAM-dependent methyltransferase n=1 Tax=Sulfobacillus thermosulfidooxidans TaxID=28034 RepID=UPI00030BEFDE|nr:class I SAM-dependent methyltransferase [Sulfobacillus thermosulfidooxidans]
MLSIDWDQAYSHGMYLSEWDYAYPSQELATCVAAQLIPAGGKVIDLGCGSGTDAIFLAKLGFRVIGLDISKVALDIAHQKSMQAQVSVEWIHANALNMPVDTGSCDFVSDRGLMHHLILSEQQRYIQEVARILKPHGRFLLRGASHDYHETFIPITSFLIDTLFDPNIFSCGPVIPFVMQADSGPLESTLVIATRQ